MPPYRNPKKAKQACSLQTVTCRLGDYTDHCGSAIWYHLSFLCSDEMMRELLAPTASSTASIRQEPCQGWSPKIMLPDPCRLGEDLGSLIPVPLLLAFLHTIGRELSPLKSSHVSRYYIIKTINMDTCWFGAARSHGSSYTNLTVSSIKINLENFHFHNGKKSVPPCLELLAFASSIRLSVLHYFDL